MCLIEVGAFAVACKAVHVMRREWGKSARTEGVAEVRETMAATSRPVYTLLPVAPFGWWGFVAGLIVGASVVLGWPWMVATGHEIVTVLGGVPLLEGFAYGPSLLGLTVLGGVIMRGDHN